jgi:hypothetical protein
MFSHDLIDLRVWNDMNPNSRHSSIGILAVISQLTRETESRHRNGNPYGHDQTNNCHIIACRSEYRLGTARRYYQGTRSPAKPTTRKTSRRRRRKAALQVIAVIAGITTAWLVGPAVPAFLPHDFTGKLALGLLASGGSGFWNSILTYLTKAKDVKAAEAETRQIEARAKTTTLPKHGH